MIDQKSKNQEHIVFNNSEISYEEYIEDIEEVEKERAKSFDAPRRVLSLVKKKKYIILTFNSSYLIKIFFIYISGGKMAGMAGYFDVLRIKIGNDRD